MAFNVQAQLVLRPPTNVSAVIATINSRFARGINANVNVGINGAQLGRINALGKSLGVVNKNLNSSAKSASSFGAQMGLATRRFGAFVLATTAIVRLAGAFKQSLSNAIEFDRELVKIAQVTGQTTTNLGRLTKEVTRLSTSLGVDSSKLLQTSRVLAQTGLTAAETQVALEALAKSSLAPTFGEITRTVEVSIAAMRQFNLEAKDLDATLGSINAISKSFAVESDDLGTAIRRAGGAFAATGGQLNELLALFTSVRSTTRESAESIGTGFRTIFTRLQRVSTLNFLGDLGIDLRNAQGEFEGGFKAIERLSEGLAGLSKRDPRFAQIIEELGGFRQVSKVIPLIEQFGTAQRALAVATRGQNSLNKDAETAQQALGVQITKVKEEFEDLIRTLANSSSFRAMVDVVLDLAKALTQVARALEPVLPLLGLLAAGGLARGVGNIRNLGADFKGSLLGRNEGGGVPGIGSSDTVPAMLTPGEFVLQKSAVDSIGLSSLHSMNRSGRRGFNKGGFVGGVQHFATGGSVATSAGNALPGVAAFAIVTASLTNTFAKLEGVTEQIVQGFISFGSQFFLFKSAGQRIAAAGQAGETLARQQRILGISTKRLASANLDEVAAVQARKTLVSNRAANPNFSADKIAADLQVDSARRTVRANERRNERLTTQTNRTSSRLAAFGNGLAATSALLSAAGIAFAAAGRNRLAETGGKEGGSQVLGGGIATGIGVGAGAGALAGSAIPVIGTAIGAGVGAVAGGVIGAIQGLDEIESTVDSLQIDKTIAKFAGTLENFNAGRASAAQGIRGLNTAIDRIQSDLLTVGADARQSLRAQISQQSAPLEAFLTRFISAGTTVEAFRAKTAEIVPFLANILNLPVGELQKSFEDQIDRTNKVVAANKELEETLKRTTERLREISGITRAVNDAQTAMGAFINPVVNATKQLERLDQSAIFDRLDSVQDIGQFDAIAQSIGGIAGPAGKLLADEATEIAKAFKRLPDTLLSLGKDSPLDEEGNFTKRLDAELKTTPKFIRDAIQARIKKIIGEGGKEGNFIKKINSDLLGLVNELLGGLKDIPEALKTISGAVIPELNLLAGLFQQRVGLEQQLLDSLDSTITKRLDAEERLASITQTRLRPGRRQTADNDRFANLTQDLNVGRNAVNSLSNIIFDAKDRIRDLEKSLSTVDANNFTQLNDNLATQQTRLLDANKALKFLADGANRAAPALRELQDVQKDRETLFDLSKSFTFADAAGRREIGNNIAAAVAISQQGANAVPGNLRSGALSLLESLGDVQLGILGGRSGNDVVKQATAQQLTQIGLSPQEVKAIVEATPRELQLIQQVTDAGRTAIEASEALSDAIGDDIDKLNDTLESRFGSFLDKLGRLLQQTFVDSKQADVDAAAKELSASGEAQQQINQLGQFGINTQSELEGARAFVGFQTERKQLGEEGNAISGVEIIKDAFANFITGENVRGVGIDALSPQVAQPTLDAGQTRILIEALESALTKGGLQSTRVNEIIQGVTSGSEGFRGRRTARSIFESAFGSEGAAADEFGGKATEDSIAGKTIQDERDRIRLALADINKEMQKLGLSTETFSFFNENLADLTDTLDSLDKDANILKIAEQVREAAKVFKEAEAELKRVREAATPDGRAPGVGGFASGGFVGGSGSGDIIPALLTPGEFVLRKQAVAGLDPDFLQGLNSGGISKFASGGFVSREDELRRRRLAAIQARERRRQVAISRNTGGTGFLARQNDDARQRRLERTRDAINSAPLSVRRREDIIPFRGVVANPNSASQGGGVGSNPPAGVPSGATNGTTIGSAATTSGPNLDSGSVAQFGDFVNKFANVANNLAKSISNIPSSITMTGTHKVEVIINGAEVFQTMKPEFTKMITTQIKENLNKFVGDFMPSQGKKFEPTSKFSNLDGAPGGLVQSARSVAAGG